MPVLFFSIRRLMKKISDLIIKQSCASLPYGFSFILVGESYLYCENSPTSLLFSRVGKRCFFFEKNSMIMKIKIKIKTYSRNCFLIQFHILCENFRKIGRKIKKDGEFGDGPLHCSIKLVHDFKNPLEISYKNTYVPCSKLKAYFIPYTIISMTLSFVNFVTILQAFTTG